MTVINTDPFPLSSVFQVLFIDYAQTSSCADWAVLPSKEGPGQTLPICPHSPLSFLRKKKNLPPFEILGKMAPIMHGFVFSIC